jgi:hypothetical protein
VNLRLVTGALKACEDEVWTRGNEPLQDAEETEELEVPTGLWRHRYQRFLSRLGLNPDAANDESIIALAVPAVLALAADPLLSLVDTAYVGRIGPDELVRWARPHTHCSCPTCLSSQIAAWLSVCRYLPRGAPSAELLKCLSP